MNIDMKNRQIVLKAYGCWANRYAKIPFDSSIVAEGRKIRPEEIRTLELINGSKGVCIILKAKDSLVVTGIKMIETRESNIVNQTGLGKMSKKEGDLNMETYIFPGGICVSAEGHGPLRREREIIFSLSPGAHILLEESPGRFLLLMNNCGNLVEEMSRNLARLQELSISNLENNEEVLPKQLENIIPVLRERFGAFFRKIINA